MTILLLKPLTVFSPRWLIDRGDDAYILSMMTTDQLSRDTPVGCPPIYLDAAQGRVCFPRAEGAGDGGQPRRRLGGRDPPLRRFRGGGGAVDGRPWGGGGGRRGAKKRSGRRLWRRGVTRYCSRYLA